VTPDPSLELVRSLTVERRQPIPALTRDPQLDDLRAVIHLLADLLGQPGKAHS
jgi:hypothetical protein